jgi:hypothetical protein
MPGTNTSLSQKFVNYGQKSFITLAPDVSAIRLSLSLANKLDYFSLAKIFRQVIYVLVTGS